jgi:transcriptional regulator with XRE-family HTH domain
MARDGEAPNLDALAEFIRTRRRELGLTQVQLAERLIWEQKRVSNLESAKYGLPSLPLLAHLADALDVPLSTVLRRLGYLQEESAGVHLAEAQSSHCAALLFCLERLLAIRATGFTAVFASSAGVIAEAMGADAVAVYLEDQSGRYLELIGTNRQDTEEHLRRLGLDRVPAGEPGRLGAVFQHQEPYSSGNVDGDTNLNSGLLEVMRARSLLIAPISSVQRYGVLVASSIYADRFSDDDRVFVQAVANWLALIAHRSSLLV